MEALEGESLARVLHREGPLPLGRAVRILLQICQALDAAHQRGIVHRDLKPENVFLLRRPDGSDFVKVLDFGIAKSATSPEASRFTRAGSIIGTPEYMSPEQAAGTGADPRSDVYSLGVVAYEVLTGRLPLEGDSAISTLLKHQSEAPLPPRRWRPDLPAEVEALVLRLLAKRPEARPPTMAVAAHQLSSAVAGIDVDARPTPVVAPPVPPPRASSSAPPSYAPPPPGAVPARGGAERGGTMPLVGLDELAAATPVPGRAGTPATGALPAGAGADPTQARRLRSQLAVAFVLGLLGVGLLGAVVAAVVARRGDGTGEPLATVVVEPIPAGLPAAAEAPEPIPARAPAATGVPDGARAPAEPARPSRRKGTKAGGPGTGAPARSGQNGVRAEDLIDPYR
jgi:serine/threonine-protein kinase